MRMKLSEWAKEQNICYRTAWNWLKEGKIKNYEIDDNRRVYVIKEEDNTSTDVFVYSRVSSHDKKLDLLNQARLCEDFCAAKGWIVTKTFKEIGSGMNDNRKILNKILTTPPKRLIVLHKDRLTRFGFNYIKLILESKKCELVVINENKTPDEDLLKDFIAVITSFCCRLYGARRGQAKALKLKTEIKND